MRYLDVKNRNKDCKVRKKHKRLKELLQESMCILEEINSKKNKREQKINGRKKREMNEPETFENL